MLLLLVLLALTLISLCFFCKQLRYMIKHFCAHAKDRSFHAVVAVLVLLGLATAASAAGLGVCCTQYRHRDADSPPPEETTDSDISLSSDPFPELTTTSAPARSLQDIVPVPDPVLCLSKVENSEMLALADTLIQNGDKINADLLVTAIERFDTYLDKYSNSFGFFLFYENLAAYFPEGKDTLDLSHTAETLEEHIAQIRYEGDQLKNAKEDESPSRISKYCYWLVVSSRNALYCIKYPVLDSQEYKDIWLYAEIAFAASINQHTYSQPQGTSLSDWYFRLADVFDYLGNIADTSELQLKLYFLSTVFFYRAIEILNEGGTQIYSNTYDHEIWDRYMEMLARVAQCVKDSAVSGCEEFSNSFLEKIWEIETSLEDKNLPENKAAEIDETLSQLNNYQSWKKVTGYVEDTNT